MQVYNEAVGSDYDFVKTSVRWQKLAQFGEESPDARHGYKLELAGGAATPFGDTEDVPYSERYFLGGHRTLRGFDFRGVGPNENGFPLGGQTYTSFTAEYRRPLIKTIQPGTFREVEVIRGGFFLDAGILDPEDWRLDSNELRASAGVFVGLTMPLAFTFSFGFPLLEGDGDDTQVFQFNIGF